MAEADGRNIKAEADELMKRSVDCHACASEIKLKQMEGQ